MRKTVIRIAALFAIVPFFANAGIFSSREVKLKSDCLSADGKYTASYKHFVTGNREEVLDIVTEFNMTDKVSGQEYRYYKTDDYYKNDTLSDVLDFAVQGQHIFVSINRGENGNELVDLFCRRLPQQNPNSPKSPNLVLKLPAGFFASLPNKIEQPMFVDGRIYDSYANPAVVPYVNFGQKSIGACALYVFAWSHVKNGTSADNQSVKLTYLGQRSNDPTYEFAGATWTHQYMMTCDERALGPVVGYKKAEMGVYTMPGALNAQQLMNLIMKAIPRELFSFAN